MPAIEKFEFSSTVDHAQYWQGVGVSFTEFDEVFTGFGDTEREALDDAIEQFAMSYSGSLVTDEMNAERETANNTDSAHKNCDPDDDDMCEIYWYVSLFVKWKEEEEIKQNSLQKLLTFIRSLWYNVFTRSEGR